MAMFLRYIADLVKRHRFCSKWCVYSFGFLIVAQFLDGLTTKIGLSVGCAEVGKFAMPILGSYGFWGLMAWKFGVMLSIGALVAVTYFAARKYDPKNLNYVRMILTIGFLIASIGTTQVVVSNVNQIEIALHA
jgi:hypothetical protein